MLRAWRPELLEQRLALSHAPLADDGSGLAVVAANHSAAMYVAPLPVNDAHDNDSKGQPGLGGLAGQIPAGNNQPLLRFDAGPGGGSIHAVSSALTSPDGDDLELISVVRSADNSGLELIVVARIADPSTAGIHPLAEADVPNVSTVLTFGIPAVDQSGITHIGPAVASAYPAVVQNSTAIVPNNNVPVSMPADVVHRVIEAEPPNAVAVLPLLERPPLNREHPPAPSSHFERTQPRGGSAESSDVVVESSADPLARETLMASIAVNFDAIDRALELTLDEIEQMGGDLAAWLDESNAFALASAGAAVLLAGGGSYYWRRRRVARLAGKDLEEPSSWLFTHLYNPPVRP